MKLRAIRRDHIVIAIAAALFALGLITINVMWPAAFGVFIAIGGVIGLVLALKEHRRHGLSRALVELLEKQAADLGKTEIMCTIHPKNEPSESLFALLGYSRVDTVSTSYGKRAVLARKLPLPNKQWAR